MHDRRIKHFTAVGHARRAPKFRLLVVTFLAAFLVAAVSAGPALAQNFYGTSGADIITGTSQQDWMHGYGSGDVMSGLGSADTMLGGSGGDVMFGGLGPDSIQGNLGLDSLYGEQGNDTLWGLCTTTGGCWDALPDWLQGGNGADSIHALNIPAKADTVKGGGGTDSCSSDAIDTVTGCP